VITIQGLTHKQKVFMDVMWSMDSMPAVQAFIKSLPTRDGQDCASLVTIAVQDTMEQDNRIQDYEELAGIVIARASRR